ncbi:hypothetical protein [Catelliglobosispora koreensis]|uniref:hypothetical protein n=1 Tax=Catelliglobosispora koreensis TaxID=129052 RepID=UPI000375E941|nr:hypothetical protein [Catelliglobosispora koreensis]
MTTQEVLPYATMLSFARYIGRTGPAKATFVGGLRKQRESGGGFNPHGQFIKALKADIQFRTGGTHIAKVVHTVHPRWQRLYATLAEGAKIYLRDLGTPGDASLLPVHDAIGIISGLPVKVSAHFGLLRDSGQREAVRLYFDEHEPSDETLTAMSHLMASQIDQILPQATPVIVDIRRGIAHRPTRASKEDTQRWIDGEAAGFRAMWRAA